jgi:4-methylaminobutanoate oxidase (formaldehyde-forming)
VILSTAELQQRVPWLDIDAKGQAVCIPGAGFIDPYLATMGYADRARKAGAVLRRHTSVLEIVVNDGVVGGVRTEQSLIKARTVVLAGGAWSAVLLDSMNISLPTAPVRSHYWITTPADSFAPDQPVVLLPDAHAYTRPEGDRLVLGVRESASPSWDARLLPPDVGDVALASTEEQWNGLIERGEALSRFIPRLDELGMVHYIAGLSTYTPDGKFVIGRAEGVGGLVIATGCNGNGVAASAGIAHLVADIIHDRRSPIDIAPFVPDRFGAVDAYSSAFRERCSAARGSKGCRDAHLEQVRCVTLQ